MIIKSDFPLMVFNKIFMILK